MNFQKIKELVEYYEDRIIINFEKHFSDLILEDFYDGGFEDRLEDELYYEEYYTQYEDGIIDLLFTIQNKTDDKYIDFRRRLIILKRTIDTKLSKITTEIKLEKIKHQRKSAFLLNQNIDNYKFIEFLHKQLVNNKLIKTDINNFNYHFKDEWQTKIQWLGTELQIVNLITLLIENNFLDDETKKFKNKLISSHFLNKKGNRFVEKQLSSCFADKKDTLFNDITNSIMDEICTYFQPINPLSKDTSL